MWQQKPRRCMALPGAHPLGERAASFRQVVPLGVLTDEQSAANIREQGSDGSVPLGCAFRAWRQVSRLGFAGIAESHGHDGNAGEIIEFGTRDAQPFAQASTAGIVPWNAAGMNLCAGSLADDQYTSTAGDSEHRIGSRNATLAQGARANALHQFVQFLRSCQSRLGFSHRAGSITGHLQEP